MLGRVSQALRHRAVPTLGTAWDLVADPVLLSGAVISCPPGPLGCQESLW